MSQECSQGRWGGGALRSREGRGIGRDGRVVEDGACVCVWVYARRDDAAAVEGASVRWDRVRVWRVSLFLNSGSFFGPQRRVVRRLLVQNHVVVVHRQTDSHD